jgi:hypothetical protein
MVLAVTLTEHRSITSADTSLLDGWMSGVVIRSGFSQTVDLSIFCTLTLFPPALWQGGGLVRHLLHCANRYRLVGA